MRLTKNENKIYDTKHYKSSSKLKILHKSIIKIKMKLARCVLNLSLFFDERIPFQNNLIPSDCVSHDMKLVKMQL